MSQMPTKRIPAAKKAYVVVLMDHALLRRVNAHAAQVDRSRSSAIVTLLRESLDSLEAARS